MINDNARILIVEDEALVAMELRFQLEDLGYEVVGTASDARSGRRLAQGGDVDLALVDIHLTDGPSGIELGRELAGLGVTVLYLTANPAMLGLGVVGTIGVLPKPTDEAGVETCVAYALRCRDGEVSVRVPPQMRAFG